MRFPQEMHLLYSGSVSPSSHSSPADFSLINELSKQKTLCSGDGLICQIQSNNLHTKGKNLTRESQCPWDRNRERERAWKIISTLRWLRLKSLNVSSFSYQKKYHGCKIRQIFTGSVHNILCLSFPPQRTSPPGMDLLHFGLDFWFSRPKWATGGESRCAIIIIVTIAFATSHRLLAFSSSSSE